LVAITPSVVFPAIAGRGISRPQQPPRIGETATVRRAHSGEHPSRRGIDDVAYGIHRDERRDNRPVCQRHRGCSESALHRTPRPRQLADGRARSGADVAFGDRTGTCRRRRAIAALRIRPNLRVPSDSEIDEDCRGHDRNVDRADRVFPELELESHVAFVEVAHHAAGRVESERTAAGQDDRVNLLHAVDGIEEIRFACGGAAPRTSTPAVAPASTRITVQPVGRSVNV
jgi:hypothetical protein